MFNIFKSISPQQGSDQLSEAIREGAFLVDVRTTAEFLTGSVKGAVNIPLDKLTSQLQKFKDKKSIVVFCRSGNRSSYAKEILEQKGFRNVIDGGTWQNVNALTSARRESTKLL
jgi:rhodanese-related sulfurtransferase